MDPLMLKTYRPLLSEQGRRTLNRALMFNIVTGVVDGVSLMTLLPLASVLTDMSLGERNPVVLGLDPLGWVITLVVLAIGGAVLNYYATVVGYLAAVDFLRTGQHAIGNKLAVLPLGWFRRSRVGEISSLVSSGFMTAGNGVAHMVPVLARQTTTAVTVLVLSWFGDWRLGLTLTCALPVAVGLMWVARVIRRRASAPVHVASTELASRVVEFAACQPALRAAGRSQDYAPLQRAAAADHRARHKELWLSTVGILLNGISVQIVSVAAILTAAALAVAGHLSAAATVAYVGLVLRFSTTVNEIGEKNLGVVEASVPLGKTQAILDTPALEEPESGNEAMLPEPGAVELESVTFGYGADPVLQDVSLRMEPGTLTALVGPSGSGKTTLAMLVARFWDVDSGSVRVSGADVREQTTEQLMGQLSMVFQDVYLFDDTLEANVRVGRPTATDEEVREAADLAGVTPIAERLPNGWQTRVGEGGRSLSGGERQRVSVARALLKKAPIVLFDEATSALDAENESHVMASIQRLRATSTVLVIAHKLDTVRHADRIVVLGPDGRVAQSGTHEELAAVADGPYRGFLDRREAATGWSLAGRG